MKKQVILYRVVTILLSVIVLGVFITACGVPSLAPPQNQTQPQTSIKQTFENQITLLGFTATDAHNRLQLFWQAVNIPSGDCCLRPHLG